MNQFLSDSACKSVCCIFPISKEELTSTGQAGAEIPILLAEIAGVQITGLADGTQASFTQEGSDGKLDYYRLVPERTNNKAADHTDVWAVEQGNVSITPLHASLLNRSVPVIPPGLSSDLFQWLQDYGEHCSELPLAIEASEQDIM